LSQEFLNLEELHKQYKVKVDEIEALQSKCKQGVKNHSKRLKEVSSKLKSAIAKENSSETELESSKSGEVKTSVKFQTGEDSVHFERKDETATKLSELKTIREEIAVRKNEIRDIEDVLPKDNGIYLRIILGTVNVSLLSKAAKYAYKNDYELFKLRVTSVGIIPSLIVDLK